MNGNQSNISENRPPQDGRNMLGVDYAYSSSQVGKATGVTSSSIRKYSITLEAQGYTIIRDEHNNRVYVDKDIAVIRKMIEYVSKGATVVNAAKAVISEMGEVDPQVNELQPEINNEAVNKLLEHIQEQDERHNKFISEQSEKMDEQSAKIDELTELIKNDRAERIEEASKPEKKPGLFKRLFK